MKLCTNNVIHTHIELLHSIFFKGRGSQAESETEVTLMFVKATIYFLQWYLHTHIIYYTHKHIDYVCNMYTPNQMLNYTMSCIYSVAHMHTQPMLYIIHHSHVTTNRKNMSTMYLKILTIIWRLHVQTNLKTKLLPLTPLLQTYSLLSAYLQNQWQHPSTRI